MYFLSIQSRNPNILTGLPAHRGWSFVRIQHQHAALNPLRIDTGFSRQGFGKLRIHTLADSRHAVDRGWIPPRIKRRQDTATGPGCLAAQLTALEQQDARAGLKQIPRGQHAHQTAADKNAISHRSCVESRIADANAWLERVMGIEPTPSAWEAEILPLNYTRLIAIVGSHELKS